MKRFLLDTGIAGWFINNKRGVRVRAFAEMQRGNRLGLCPPGLGELYFGAENSATPKRNLQRLILALPHFIVWPYTDTAAEEYGRIAAHLQRTGRPMQQIDIQLAAIALTLGNTTVVSADSDLHAIPGLSVENWAVP